MKNLLNKIKKIGTLSLASALLFSNGCNSDYEKITSNREVREEVVQTMNIGYDNYALDLKKEYENLFEGVDYRDISLYLQDINEGKMLRYGEQIKLPVY